MRLFANRQLCGDYGVVAAGDPFECSEDVGKHLLASGVARPAEPPRVTYETKVVTPEAPQVGARLAFCDRHLSDAEPARVAPASDSLLPAADIPAQGIADRGRRRTRPRSDAK